MRLIASLLIIASSCLTLAEFAGVTHHLLGWPLFVMTLANVVLATFLAVASVPPTVIT